MLSVRRVVGRLVEIRFDGNPSVEDVERFNSECRACVVACSAETKRRAVLCTDLRQTHLFMPDVSERLLLLMRSANPHLERNAFLGNGTALLSLQVARLVNEAVNPGRRRLFTEPEPLCNWLDEVLSAVERARMREFLGVAGGGPVARP